MGEFERAMQRIKDNQYEKYGTEFEEDECGFEGEDYDPTPWCTGCWSMTKANCNCGETAENN